MTHILAKSGRVVVQGGRVLTSEGGAPCCCGGGPGAGCYVIVLACGCDDLTQARMIDATDPALIAAWPYEDRRAGVVVSIGGVCYRFIAAMQAADDLFPLLDFADYDGVTYESCEVSPCSDQGGCGCSPLDVIITDGISIFLNYDCTDSLRACGVARIEAATQRTASRVREVFDPNEADQAKDERVEVTASGVIEGSTGGGGVVQLTGTGRAYGSRAFDGSSWDVTQTYDGLDSDEQSSFYDDSVFTSVAPYARLLRDLDPGDGFAVTSVGAEGPESTRAVCCCSDGFSDPFGGSNWSSSASLSLLRSSATFTHTQDFAGFGDGVVQWTETLTVNVTGSRRLTLTNGAVIEDNDCDNPANGGGGGGGGGTNPGGTDVGGADPTTDPALNAAAADQIGRQFGCTSCGG